MLDRLESPAWNLAHQSEQASLAQAPVARVPAAYHPKVGPRPPTPPLTPFPHPTCTQLVFAITDHAQLKSGVLQGASHGHGAVASHCQFVGSKLR